MCPAIWIDSICIDQTNEAEKAEQVQFMKSIYTKAIHVIVWLGLPDDKSDFIFDVVEEFVEHNLSRFNVPTPRDKDLFEYFDFTKDSDAPELVQLALDSSAGQAGQSEALSGSIHDFLLFMTSRQ